MSPQPQNRQGYVLCPLHAPDDPYEDRELYLVRISHLPLQLVDIGWTDPRAEAEASGWPGDPTSSTWEVRCMGGHVLAAPGGDSDANEDTDLPTAAEWALLRTLLAQPPLQVPTVWYLAICLTCEPVLPQPFRDKDERDAWATAHVDSTYDGTSSHTVKHDQEVRP